MRGRVIGLGLLGLGAFLLAGALAVRLLLDPALVKLPLDQKASPTAVGTDVSFFDIGSGRQFHGLEADVRQEVRGDPSDPSASDDVAVWNFGSTVTATDGTLLNAGTYRVCMDRHTAVAVDCPTDHVDYKRDKPVKGLTLTFPFGTGKRDYDVFNSTARQAFPATFEGVEDKGGLQTYRFEMVVPETVIQSTEVPGSLIGRPEASVTADVVYSNERMIWVEPTSGVIVTSTEKPKTELRGPDGKTAATLLAGSFGADKATVTAGAKRAEDIRGQIAMVKTVIPLTLLVLGLVALVVGGLLVRRARTDPDWSDTVEAEPVREPQVR